MRRIILKIILGGALGGMLGHMGYSVNTWEFWIVLLIVIGLMINEKED